MNSSNALHPAASFQPPFSLFRSIPKNILIALAISVFLGIFLWIYSDLPPYGRPEQESNVYWTCMIDIAHKWRTFQWFTFWDRELGGGMSLYTSSQYPLFNPTNALAWVLPDDQFYLFKVIEPFVVGCFFTILFLLEAFAVPWPFAFFSAFYFLGLGLSRQTMLPESSLFLWGCFLFPAMVYAYWKLHTKNLYLAFAVVGSLIALQFSGAGVTQVPQLAAWWLLFIAVRTLFTVKTDGTWNGFKKWGLSSGVLLLLVIGLFGIQFIPTKEFVMHESARIPGRYPVNNFCLEHILDLFVRFITHPQGISLRGVLALVLLSLAVLIKDHRKSFQHPTSKTFLPQLWITTIVYFLIPSMADMCDRLMPFLHGLFKPISMFTFRYGIHILDFCIAISLGIILHNVDLKNNFQRLSLLRQLSIFILVALAVLAVTLPAAMIIPAVKNALIAWIPVSRHFVPAGAGSTIVMCVISLIALFYLIQRPSSTLLWKLFGISLTFLGFMTMMTCYHWNNKGLRTNLDAYHLSSPEYIYYQQAHGKYYLPYATTPEMNDCFNLLYSVHGTAGFFACPPYRFNKFMATYHNDKLAHFLAGNVMQYYILRPSSNLTTYFPVEFTTIKKGETLPWKGFAKKITGERFDIWERLVAVPKMYFARQLHVVPYAQIIKNFDRPFNRTILIDADDAARFGLADVRLSDMPNASPGYANFRRPRGDRVTFDVKTSGDQFVFFPEMYQKGWRILLDGQPVEYFPADYLFIGFKVPAGEHHVTMRFVPPGFWAGLIVNVISVAVLIFLIRTVCNKKDSDKSGHPCRSFL